MTIFTYGRRWYISTSVLVNCFAPGGVPIRARNIRPCMHDAILRETENMLIDQQLYSKRSSDFEDISSPEEMGRPKYPENTTLVYRTRLKLHMVQ